ncbi:MAG: hypothetical protein COB98_09290 [Flavobacteriaceae bacterium]|nr:MAG: hypothetical protein COB98_09290 [Flavobacteriaceae bacterium]
MKFHGLIHQFPQEVKLLIGAFVIVLSIGYYTGLAFVNETTNNTPTGIEEQYLGNENDEEATVMKFKKKKQAIITLIHNHMISLSVLFFMLSLLVSITSFNKTLKKVVMIEPFVSILVSFGGIYFMWLGMTSLKYVVMLSGILMTMSFITATFMILFSLVKTPPIK